MSAAAIATFNWVELMKVVVRGEPFHCTTEPERNPEPFTTRLKAPVPAVAVDGEREETTGAGFETTTPIVPPVPVTGVSMPSGKALIRPLSDTGIEVSVAPEVSVRVTEATLPLAMVVAFMPEVTQMVEEDRLVHETDLPAAVRAGPAATETEAMSAEG